MDIKGVVYTTVCIQGSDRIINHTFGVLNKETFTSILLGRDFIAKLGQVTFDVKRSTIQVGRRWSKGRKLLEEGVHR